MQFAKALRDRVRSGEVTCSVRIWRSQRVKPGGRYPLPGGGWIEVEAVQPIAMADARRAGFAGVVDLLKTAKHGGGEKVYLVTFHYVEG